MKEKLFYYMLGSLFCADILLKYIIDTYKINIALSAFFGITLVRNTGVSFGLFKGSNLLMIIISFIIIVFLIELIRRYAGFRYGLVMILAGAAGNLIDRIVRGYIVDYINLSFWPAFNISDLLIAAGAIYILIRLSLEQDNGKIS